MNLHKKCLICGEFFPAKPMEFKFFCQKEECLKYKRYRLQYIKKLRHIPPRYFDLYDLDRPLKHGEKIVPYMYERVCRECGKPLLNKNGKYSYHKRYCNEHNGNELWARYNWGVVSKDYAYKIRDKYEELIISKMKEKKIEEKEFNNIIICENCQKLCQIYSLTSLYRKFKLKVINIHHITPIHTLDWSNLHLIWDKNNLIALCEDCHNQQDHQLKKIKVDPYINFKKITEFIE